LGTHGRVLSGERAKDVSRVADFAIKMVNNLGWFNSSRGGHHLIKNGAILALVSHSLHLRSGRVEEIHAGPQNTLEFSAVREFVLGLSNFLVWLLDPI
jgi:hypothetical protein